MKTRPYVGGRKRDPNHEGPSPGISVVTSRPQVGTPSPALPHPQPATGKEKGRAMVLRRNRTRRLLLWTGDDHARAARGVDESRYVLPRRSNHGAAEGLNRRLRLADTLVLVGSPFLWERALSLFATSVETVCGRIQSSLRDLNHFHRFPSAEPLVYWRTPLRGSRRPSRWLRS